MNLMSRTNGNRVFAMDIRADRIGYAVFGAPNQLVDYGTSRFRSEKVGKARIEFLLRALNPSVLVLRRPRPRSTRRRPRGDMNRRVIERGAKALGVQIVFVTERRLRAFFARFNCRNKFQVAELLGGWFPELARYVPQKRKCYEPEPWTIAYFDAIALGVAYFMLMTDAPSISSEEGILSSASR